VAVRDLGRGRVADRGGHGARALLGRTIIPLGKWSRTANVPGAKLTDPIAYPAGMPGVRVGQ
jgi:hypothetical protein